MKSSIQPELIRMGVTVMIPRENLRIGANHPAASMAAGGFQIGRGIRRREVASVRPGPMLRSS
ncbi:hypothetical protein, partial [Pseudomonas aeruginosa]|uniref:hypothetical protein n=1 Tax=Pseudomonas aeruginosa TaxID=287 RepID=UPI0031B67995